MTPQEIQVEIEGIVNWEKESSLPPNYYSSLDAMHEAKKSIMDSPTLRVLFINTLRTVVGRRIHNPSDLDLVNAESREECEAFLRTVGKWKD